MAADEGTDVNSITMSATIRGSIFSHQNHVH